MYACLERGLVIGLLKGNLLRVIPLIRNDVDEGMITSLGRLNYCFNVPPVQSPGGG
jgi:hypothetical protein